VQDIAYRPVVIFFVFERDLDFYRPLVRNRRWGFLRGGTPSFQRCSGSSAKTVCLSWEREECTGGGACCAHAWSSAVRSRRGSRLGRKGAEPPGAGSGSLSDAASRGGCSRPSCHSRGRRIGRWRCRCRRSTCACCSLN